MFITAPLDGQFDFLIILRNPLSSDMWCIDNGQAISSDILMYYVESEQTAMGEYTEHTGFDNLIS